MVLWFVTLYVKHALNLGHWLPIGQRYVFCSLGGCIKWVIYPSKKGSYALYMVKINIIFLLIVGAQSSKHV